MESSKLFELVLIEILTRLGAVRSDIVDVGV